MIVTFLQIVVDFFSAIQARDFIRAVLLYMIDQFEQSKNFIDFLKEKELVTKDAYINIVKKLKDLK